MEILLLNLFALLRPILFIDIGMNIGGLNIFELAAIFFAFILFAMLIYKMSLKKKIYVTSIDVMILLFTIWCIGIYIAYSDVAQLKQAVKLVLPLWTFIVVKNIIVHKSQFRNLLLYILIGSLIPLIVSTALILAGKGIEDISYWTDIARYKGAYSNSHNMGHNMAFIIMLVVTYSGLYFLSSKKKEHKLHTWKKIFFVILVIFAIFGLYKCWVRTAIFGLVLFLGVHLFFYNRKLLMLSLTGIIIFGVIFSPVIVPRFFADIQKVYEGEWELDMLGSGRLRLWSESLEGLSKLPIDKVIAGNGIGNLDESLSGRYVDTHSDILGLIEETGIVGFLLYFLLQLLILKKILSLEGKDKHIFLAFFIAVLFMNLLSNSYIARFGMAQYFYLIMSYVELPFSKGANSVSSFNASKNRYRLQLHSHS